MDSTCSTGLATFSCKSTDGSTLDNTGDVAKNLVDVVKGVTVPTGLSASVISNSLINSSVGSNEGNYEPAAIFISMVILAVMLRNVRLVLLTLACFIAATGAGYAMMYPIAAAMGDVSSSTPGLMLPIALAMSIDYSLFMLSRFKLEVENGLPVIEAVIIMLQTAGQVVLVSGFTLCTCFFIMQYIPVALISSMGLGAAITVIFAVFAAFCVTPVFLLTFPGFFTSFKRFGFNLSGFGCCPCVPNDEVNMEWKPTHTLEDDHVTDLRASTRRRTSRAARVADGESIEGHTRESKWGKIGDYTMQYDWAVLLVLICVAIPFISLGFGDKGLEKSLGYLPLMKRDADETTILRNLEATFGPGPVFSMTMFVVKDTPITSAADQKQWLTTLCTNLQEVARVTNANKPGSLATFTTDVYNGASMSGGECVINQTDAASVTYNADSTSYTTTLTDSNGVATSSATKITIEYAAPWFSVDGQKWMKALRDAAYAQDNGRWYVKGTAFDQLDSADSAFDHFVGMLGLMGAAIVVILFASLRSVVICIRALFTLAWMLFITFGVGILTYQGSMFKWLGYDNMKEDSSGAMAWYAPSIALAICTGLGLDYDIFYSETVAEEWHHGHDEKQSARRALCATGNTISAAGAIMIVAFFPLLICNQPILNQVGLLLIVSVFVDCFLSTKFLIPASISLASRCSRVCCHITFWPSKQSAGLLDGTTTEMDDHDTTIGKI